MIESLEHRLLLTDLSGVVIDDHPTEGKIAGVDIDGSIVNGIYVAKGDVSRIHLGGNLAESGVILVDGNLDELIVDGSIEGIVHVTGSIGRIQAANMGIIDTEGVTATVTAGGGIEEVDIRLAMKDCYILAGFNPGISSSAISDPNFDPTLLTVELTLDGMAVDPNEAPQQGDIKTVHIGKLENSVAAAGVGPGSNTIFGDIDGSDLPGPGESRILDVKIDSLAQAVSATTYGIFADTEIDSLKIGNTKFSVPLSLSNGFRAWTIAAPSTGQPNGVIVTKGKPLQQEVGDKVVEVKMNGPGIGYVQWAWSGTDIEYIGQIELTGATDHTQLKIQAKGKDTIDVGRIITQDDSSVYLISLDGRIVGDGDDFTNDVEIDGSVRQVQAGGGAGNVEIVIRGNAERLNLGVIGSTIVSASSVDVLGDIQQITLIDGSDVLRNPLYITANNIAKMKVTGDFDGTLNAEDRLLGTVSISGDLIGVLSSDRDIHSIAVKGMTGDNGAIRAGHDIRSFSTARLHTAVVAAGGDLIQVKIKGDVIYSTLASGLDIGAGGILSDGDDRALEGNVVKVSIGGDFVESNIIAGLTAGVDGAFGTSDDMMQDKSIEDVDAPRIADVYFADKNTICIRFLSPPQDAASNILQVVIKGEARGSANPNDTFAIEASGTIQTVTANRQPFGGSGNLVRKTVEIKGIDGSIFNVPDLNPTIAAGYAIRITTDGLDQVFGTDDDILLSSDAVPSTQPTMFVTFDEATNTVSIHKTDGFSITPDGSNYYQIFMDASQVVSRMNIPLDGDYEMELPTGDGVPGGNFTYYFAVADLGDTVATAFSPTPDIFCENCLYEYVSQLGDDLFFDAADNLGEKDYVRLNGLKAGQILNVTAEDTLSRPSWWSWDNTDITFDLQLFRIEEAGREMSVFSVREIDAVTDPDRDLTYDLVAPELDELAFAVNQFYGYENIGQQFYTIDPVTYEIAMMTNDLADLNGTPGVKAQGGIIVELAALAGHSSDSLWAIASYQITGQSQSTPRLVRIDKISNDVNVGAQGERANVVVSANPITNFSSIVGLAEWNGTLYGIDGASNTLLTLGSDPSESATFGVAQAVGSEVGNLDNPDLNITGLAADPEGTGLIALHDQPSGVGDNLMMDALYSVNPLTGQASLLQKLTATIEEDLVYHGLASRPNGVILVGNPLRGSPVGDEMEITLEAPGMEFTTDHLFGSTTSNLGGGVTISSTTLLVPENARLQRFVDSGFYYGFQIGYTPNRGAIEITVKDIQWINDTEEGSVLDVITDDADFVDVNWGQLYDALTDTLASAIEITIDTNGGSGIANVYFTGTGNIVRLENPQLSQAGKVFGDSNRTDLESAGMLTADTIVSDLQEFAISTESFTVFDITTASLLDYNAVGYDRSQDLFVYVNTTTMDARPIYVPDPTDLPNTVVLHGSTLSDIYNIIYPMSNPTIDITFDSIRGLEFGPSGELLAIVHVSDFTTGVEVERDSLLLIESIANPMAGMALSDHDLNVEYGLENVTELACGVMLNQSDPDNGILYGYDKPTQTLVAIDWRVQVRNASNALVNNPNFGAASVVGGEDEFGNLADPGASSFALTGMDFDSKGTLYAVDDTRNMLMTIDTSTLLHPDTQRMQLYQMLSAGHYTSLSYDPLGSEGFVVNSVTGTPVGDKIDLSMLYNGVFISDPQTHVFAVAGSDPFDPTNSNTLTAGALNVTITSPVTVNSQVSSRGGYYTINVSYNPALTTGDLLLTFSDVDWINGSNGGIRSIQFSDQVGVTVETFSEDSMTIRIVGSNDDGNLTIFFGATSETLNPTVGTKITFVDSSSGTGEATLNTWIPDDGDYLLTVGAPEEWWSVWNSAYQYYTSISSTAGPAVSYHASILVFNDGNSDFGITTTDSGILYDPVAPSNSPVDLGPDSTDLTVDADNPNLYRAVDRNNPSRLDTKYPIEVSGTLLVPGQASKVVIQASLDCYLDADVYTFQLNQGQKVTLDIDAETLFGRDDVNITLGLYNGDLESATTISEYNIAATPEPAEAPDPIYTAQSVFTMPNHSSVTIDPNQDGVATYYVVVSGASVRGDTYLNHETPYVLTITTTAPETVAAPPSQLVWLAVDGASAEYLYEDDGYPASTIARPAFDLTDFKLGITGKDNTSREWFKQQVLNRIEQYYREAGLGPNEIQFTLTKPALGKVYSTVIFGGTLDTGLLGLAESVDRDNANRTDKAVVLTEEIARDYLKFMDADSSVRIEQAINAVANTGAHELGHILGLEHATEVNVAEPDNIMNYNSIEVDLMVQHFEERNDYWYQDLGFTNEIDLLLRNIGSGTAMGA